MLRTKVVSRYKSSLEGWLFILRRKKDELFYRVLVCMDYFLLSCVCSCLVFMVKNFKQLKRKRKQYEEKLAQEKDMFSHLTSDVFDKIEPIDLNKSCYFSY